MRRQRLKVHTGCVPCKARRKKCDETKPICTSCLRLLLACHYSTTVEQKSLGSNGRDLVTRAGANTDSAARHELQYDDASVSVAGYDDPSVLQGSATSIIRNRGDKDAFQYICEAGAAIVRYPTRQFPGFSNVNSFRMGFQMASHFSPQIHAILAIGAAHLAKSKRDNSTSSISHYVAAISGIRTDIQKYTHPREWTCATAALMCVYELIEFSTVHDRLVHLRGFNHLVEARLSHNLPWGPFTLLVDHYCHALIINALPHFRLVVAAKDIDYVSRVIATVRGKSHAIGSEIVGMPEQLAIAAYKLSFLTYQDTSQSPWTIELLGISKKLQAWSPSRHALAIAADGLLLVGRLYHAACLCYCWYLFNKDISLSEPKVTAILDQVIVWLQISCIRERPYTCVAWPLVILGLFTRSAEHRQAILEPLIGLVKIVHLHAYQTAIDFLHEVWRLDIGPRAIHRPELLAMFIL